MIIIIKHITMYSTQCSNAVLLFLHALHNALWMLTPTLAYQPNLCKISSLISTLPCRNNNTLQMSYADMKAVLGAQLVWIWLSDIGGDTSFTIKTWLSCTQLISYLSATQSYSPPMYTSTKWITLVCTLHDKVVIFVMFLANRILNIWTQKHYSLHIMYTPVHSVKITWTDYSNHHVNAC